MSSLAGCLGDDSDSDDESEGQSDSKNENEISYFIKKNYPKSNILTIVQHDQLGVAHAVKISKHFIGRDNFILYLGDNLFENGINKLINEF